METCLFLQCLAPWAKAAAGGCGCASDTDAAPDVVASISQDALPGLDLSRYKGVIISMLADQRLLARHEEQLADYVRSGGTLVVNGHVRHAFLPWLRPFEAIENPRPADYAVRRVADHPVFDGVEERDLTYRRGVTGFYGRGANPPPDGAVVLNRLGGDDAPVDWTLTISGGGRLLVHSGLDLWAYAGDDTSAARMTPQLLDWMRTDIAGRA